MLPELRIELVFSGRPNLKQPLKQHSTTSTSNQVVAFIGSSALVGMDVWPKTYLL